MIRKRRKSRWNGCQAWELRLTWEKVSPEYGGVSEQKQSLGVRLCHTWDSGQGGELQGTVACEGRIACGWLELSRHRKDAQGWATLTRVSEKQQQRAVKAMGWLLQEESTQLPDDLATLFLLRETS